ncbi:phenylalanine--tRNA ligase subunit beta, partial [Amnimonas aquatica]
ARTLDLDGPVFLFELELSALTEGTLPVFRPLSRFPEVRRDLALVVPDTLPAGEVLAVARGAAGDSLRDLQAFDVYRGQGTTAGTYSLAIALVWQHAERTLQDSEVQAWTEQVLADLAGQGVRLRA